MVGVSTVFGMHFCRLAEGSVNFINPGLDGVSRSSDLGLTAMKFLLTNAVTQGN